MGGAAVVKRGFDLPRLVVDVGVAPKVALPRQCIAIPAIDDESEVLLTPNLAFLDRFVTTARITRGTEHRFTVFHNPSTERIINIGGAHVLAVALHHAVEVVPDKCGDFAVVNALGHVATCVIFVVRADVVFEEVVEDFVRALLRRGNGVCGLLSLMRLVRVFIRRARCHRGDVARRVKRKQFLPQ